MEKGKSNINIAPLGRPLPAKLLTEEKRSKLSFLTFDLLPAERQLLRGGKPVELGSRAFDLLVTLVCARGQIVPKAALFDHVWPSMIVEKSNLRFQMATLRKALGSERDIIKTVQGRGYLFTAEVRDEEATSVTAPLAGGTWEANGATSKTFAHQACQSAGTAHVAVLDDDDSTREALDAFLRCSGYSPICFSSAADFNRRASNLNLSCLVLDVWMPERTGLELQLDLKTSHPSLPIIFISGHADVHMSVRAMKGGAVEFLTKPVRHEELLAAINEALRGRTRERSWQ